MIPMDSHEVAMKKSVRFSELSYIQESEEDQGEITLDVPDFSASSVSPTGAPALSSLPTRQAGGPVDATKPASCPFGDRIAKKQREEVQTQKIAPEKEENELKFPGNIILLQEQEKVKAAKKKKTAGINPTAGKDRGTSFIIARNYLYNATDNSDKFLPRGLSSQTIDFSGVSTDNCSTNQASASLANQDDRFVTKDNEEVSAEAVINTGPIPSTSCNQPPASSIENNRIYNFSALPPYSPNPVLTSTVNPYLAPSNQWHGSVAYDLNPLPYENLSKSDVIVSSKVNQYLHSSRDSFTSLPGNSPFPNTNQNGLLDTSNEQEVRHQATASTDQNCEGISTDSVLLSDLLKTDTPSLQFLRDNFGVPVPVSSNKLFHVHPCISRSHPVDPSIAPQTNDSRVKANISQAPSGPVPVIGPIVSSPRKQAIPCKSASPIPGSNREPLITTNPSPAITTKNALQVGASNNSLPTGAPNKSLPVEVPHCPLSVEAPNNASSAATASTTMSVTGGGQGIYSGVVQLSRVQEKEELQRLNDRFTNYVSRVRQLGQQFNNVDTSAFLRSTKILEDEIVTLKSMYEKELEALRNEIEYNSQERNSLNSQVNKQHKTTGELQDRLAIETEKNSRLLDEINVLQRKIVNLEAEIQDLRVSYHRPKEEIDQMQRTIDNLTREAEQWKHRYEHENLARQEIEDKFQQVRKKIEFSDQVHIQQAADFQSRLDTSSATILTLEAKIRELSTADVTVAEMLKQVRDTAEAELRKYQIESDEQYGRNLAALKAQIDHDADALQRIQTEKSELMGNIGELHAKIRNLEGQVANMQHQKCTLEEMVTVERNRAADNIRQLEIKLREVQDLLVVKMKEVTNAREASLPLKAEIEMLKALMEEEERRLRIPLGIVPASVVQTSISPSPSTSQILTSSITNQILKPTSPPNALSAASAQPTAVGFVGNQQTGESIQFRPSLVQASAGSAGVSQSTTVASMSQVLPPLTRVVNPTSVTFSATSPSPLQPAAAATDKSKSVSISAMETSPTTLIHASYTYPSPGITGSCLTNGLYPYVPSPPLNTQYIPEALQSVDDTGTLAYDADYGCGQNDYELYMHGISFPMSGPRYLYEATPSLNRLHVEPSPPISPRTTGSIPARAKSAPVAQDREACKVEKVKQQKNINLIPTNLGNGRDYFDEMFKDLQQETLFSKPRPKSSPLERPLPSTFHDYTVSTSSAIGDLKILEVNQDGKFVRLHNDGPCEMEFGGYMIQQNVGGHPVAVFRFPPRTKFPPDSTVTVWAAMNDPLLHNPPTDFFWKEQQKWGTGPECTTILCRANGQAVAWTTAAHRFTKDAFQETATDADDEEKYSYTRNEGNEAVDDEALTELNIDATGPKPEPVYLRREKQQPPSLVAPKHPHGSSPCTSIHPHTGQQRPLRHGNDNSSVNRQSRTQSTRPDPIPGQPYAGAPAQRLGSAPLRKMGNSGSQSVTIRNNGMIANKSSVDIGETSGTPSPFMTPHSRFKSGLEQVQSQHHPDFLPPMPRPPHTSW